MTTPVLRLANDLVSYVLNADATAELREHASGQVWRFGAVAMQERDDPEVNAVWMRQERSSCEQFPGRFRVLRLGDDVARVVVLDELGEQRGSFIFRVRLDGEWLETGISEIDATLESLAFPTPATCSSLVLPMQQGQWIRKDRGWWHRRLVRVGNALNQRWFGMLAGDEDHGLLAVYGDGWTDAGLLTIRFTAVPVWLRSLDQWAPGTRVMRYRATIGGYVGLARAYRAWYETTGMVRTLAEKIAERPRLADMVGGRVFSLYFGHQRRRERFECEFPPVLPSAEDGVDLRLTYAQAQAIADEARALGMERGALMLHAWVRGGYDEYYPDIWPPETAFGSLEELKHLCRTVPGRLTFTHDNYQDIYQQSASFPHGVIHDRKGRLMRGGFWRGGQAFLLNSRWSQQYSERNAPLVNSLGADGAYVDTVACERFKQDYNPADRQTTAQDMERKQRLMAFWRGQGKVYASENCSDWALPWLDYGWIGNHTLTPGESVPLFSLAFRDCAVFTRGFGHPEHFENDGGAGARRCCLENLLWGYHMHWGFCGPWAESKQAFVDTLWLDRALATIGTARLTDHKHLTTDGLVQQSTYGNGLTVTVNLGPEAITVGGLTVEGNGYRLE